MSRIHIAIHAALVGVILALVVQIKGFWTVEGLEQKLETCREVVNALSAEGDKTVAVSTTNALDKDEDHAENSAVTAAAARRHIERNRLRPQIPRTASNTDSLPSRAGSTTTLPELGEGSDPEPLPETPRELTAGWVAVKEEDVLICTTNFEIAWTAWDFIQDAKRDKLMQPVTPTFPEPALSLEPQPTQ